MKIKLEVVHSIRGRTRVKIHSGYEPVVFFIIIEATLNEIGEIKKAELNPFAQSVTLHYQKDKSLDLILEKVKNVLFDITNEPSFLEQMTRIEESLRYANAANLQVKVRNKILTITNTMNNAVKRISRNNIDLKTALPMSAFTAGITTLALAPSLPTPTWLVLLIFSFPSFGQTQSKGANSQVLSPAEFQNLPCQQDRKLLGEKAEASNR